jgi:RNA polymerase sigma-70 factor, ECF subfamily
MAGETADAVLVERVRNGESAAFDLLVLKYQHRLLKLVGRYVRDPVEAEDVTQEAFVKAYRALPRFRGDSAFYTWIYRIAINTAKNHLAAMSRRTPVGGLSSVDEVLQDHDPAFADRATPERHVLTEEIRQTVENVIADLPEDLRTAVSLRELEGMSYDEIAATMECPIGTVRSRIFRAREVINKRLEPLLD